MVLSKEDIRCIMKSFSNKFCEILSDEKWRTSSLNVNAELHALSFSTGEDVDERAILVAAPQGFLDAQDRLIQTTMSSSALGFPRILKSDNIQPPFSSPYALYEHPASVSFKNSNLKTFNSSSSFKPSPTSTSSRPSDEVSARAHLALGRTLKSVHENVLNEWYGPVSATPDSGWHECLSWQECFMMLLETAFDELLTSISSPVISSSYDNPDMGTSDSWKLDEDWMKETVKGLRLALGRAFAFYVFDDVEVPSLVLSPTLDWAQRFFFDSTFSSSAMSTHSQPCTVISPEITFVGLDSALWGDPLMEGALAQYLEASPNVVEGYGGSLMQFPRQETKRLWYIVYAASMSLLTAVRERDHHRAIEAEVILKELAEKLKTAPCY